MPLSHRTFMLLWGAVTLSVGLFGCGSVVNDAGTQTKDAQSPPFVAEAPRAEAAEDLKSPRKPVELTVAAASDLKFALDELVAGFQKAHPEITVKMIFGSSGSLFAQILNDAPFDLFLAADIQYARGLTEQGKALKETLFPYALGHIVLWVPLTSPLNLDELGIQTLVDVRVKKVAIANPQHAPYGRAAEAALKNLGVYEQVSRRLVLGENIAQTTQFVDSGAADVGIIALSLALAPAMQGKGRFWRIPVDAYPPLLQGGVILNRCQDRDAAAEFQAYLIGEEGRNTLRRYGFGLPNE
ncbi:MAG: molybdate ABC transporter substrate-binding protein [Planctomycetia bacterium]|nr:molybdate ABC transporter substrate-binding protein [Planctomycetia bacterium]